MIISAFNPEIDDLERSFLSNSVSAGATSLVVKNNDRFAASDRVMVGEMAREKTEIVTASGISGGTGVTVSSLTFPHSADDPVYKLRFDQVKFYRSTTTSTGTYTLVSTQNLDVDNENSTTVYDDPTGLSTYYYKVSYYNSVTTLESAQSDAVLGSGYPRGSVGFLTDEILRETGDIEENFVNRTEILGWFNEVNDDLLTRVKKPYRFLLTRTVKNRTATATTLPFPADMYKFARMDYVFTDTAGNSTTTPVPTTPITLFRQRYGDSSGGMANDTLQTITLDGTTSVFRLYPRSATTTSDIFYIYYWKYFTELNSEGDLFETPTPRVYKLYALHRFYLKKSVADPITLSYANVWGQKYEQEITKLKRADRLDQGTPQSFRQPGEAFNSTTTPGESEFLLADDGDEIILM